MTEGEVVNKLSHECCLALGDFDHFQTVRTYIQMALRVGIEHYAKDEEEVIALYRDGTEAGRFKGVKDAAIKLGIAQSNISRVLTGKIHTAGGLKFIKTRDYELVKREDIKKPLHLSLTYSSTNT